MNQEETLRQIFLGPGMEWLAGRLRLRASRGESLAEGILKNSRATDEERSALDNFLGRKSTRAGKSLTVSLSALSSHLRRAELADSLEEVVRACYGEVTNERELQANAARDWERIFTDATEQLSPDEAGLKWIDSLRADGLLKRVAKSDPAVAGELLDTALAIWRGMPFDGVTLAELGGEHAGDTHALDRGRALSPILLRGLKFRTGYEGSKNAALRRRAWEAVGVIVDRISAPVLTFNLRARPDSVLDRILAPHAEASTPAYLTYQMLGTHGEFPPVDVYVVENPSIVESAASILGERCRPLVCTEGIPASAAKLLLRRLSESGSRIHVRADFDWTGLRIVDQLLRSNSGAKPWKMDAETYRGIPGAVALSGTPFTAPWCTELSEAMSKTGTAAYEEQMTRQLLDDLKTA